MPILRRSNRNGHAAAATLPAAPVAATSYTMTESATSGATNSPVTLTFAPVGGAWPVASIGIAITGVSDTLANGSGGTLSGTTLTVPSGTSTSCTVTMTPSTAGTATITPTNNAGMTNPGNLTYTVTSGATAPSQVGSFTAGTPTSSTIPVTYTAASGTATITYQGYTSPHGASTWTLNSGSFNGTGGTFTGLAASTSYDLRIVATNTAGSSTTDLTTGVSTAAGGAAGTVPNFSLAEWSGASSAPYARVGMAFAKGDVPSGYTPVIGSVAAQQFDARTTWSDGSLKFAVAHVRDASNFTASQSRSYSVTPTAGSFSNTGSLTLASVLSGHDFKVNFASVQTYDGTNHATLGSGSFTSSLSTAIATATRITKIHSGPVCEGWVVWNMAKDNTGGAADAHLKTYWYINAWKNSGGSVYAIEVAAVVALDWWSIANKSRLDYDAVFVDGASTIQSYSGVQHPYGSWWITCRTTADNNIGRRHWIGGAIPTLLYKPDRAYLIKSGLIPPQDLTIAPTPIHGSLLVYTPCRAGPTGVDGDEQGFYHRVSIDGTGGYLGRGALNRSDANAILLQTALDTANGRVNSLAGLSIPSHRRSNRNRTRPGETADIASTTIAQKLDNPNRAAGWDDCTADGMPTPVYAYADGRNSSTYNDGYVVASGGDITATFSMTGVWVTATGDASHATAYSYGMYLLEGEPYNLEAMLDHASWCSHQCVALGYAVRGLLLDNDSAYSSLGIPSVTYAGLGGLWKPSNQRSTGWTLNLLGQAAALVPTDHVAHNYFQKWLAQVGDWIEASLSYMPASQKAYGAFYPKPGFDGVGGQGNIPPWFLGIIAIGAYNTFLLTEDTRNRDLGDCTVKLPLGIYASGRNYIGDQYHVGDRPVATDWSTSNEFYAPGDAPAYNFDAWVTDHANGWMRQDAEGGGQNQSGGSVTMTNGDRWGVSSGSVGYPPQSIPAELTEGTRYYARDVTVGGTQSEPVFTFRLYTTPTGGSPITFSANTVATDHGRGLGVQWWPQDAVRTVVANPPYIIPADSFGPIDATAIEMARACGNTAATDTILNIERTFLAPVNRGDWSPWVLKAT